MNNTVQASSRRMWLPSPGRLTAVSMVVGLAVLAVLYGPTVARRQALIRYLEVVGADYDTEPARPTWLCSVVDNRLGDRAAAGFTNVTRIELRGRPVTEAGLRYLHGASEVKSLGLYDAEITDASVAHIRDLHSLEMLDLGDCPLTDAGLAQLGGLGNLTHLDLNNTAVGDAGLMHIRHLQNLESLILDART